MTIEEIINKPITTSEYPDPTEARHYLAKGFALDIPHLSARTK
jgi:hypothetical protein